MSPRRKARADLQEITAFWSAILRDPQQDIRNRIKVSELLAKVEGVESTEPITNPFATFTTAQLRKLIGETEEEDGNERKKEGIGDRPPGQL